MMTFLAIVAQVFASLAMLFAGAASVGDRVPPGLFFWIWLTAILLQIVASVI